MILFSTLTLETLVATLQAITNGRTDPEPQDFPVERAYRKYIFRLEKKDNEHEWEVVVKAKHLVFHDCNYPAQPTAKLIKAPAGYYLLDRPVSLVTAMGCAADHHWRMKHFDVNLRDNVFAYNSQSPLVIHAFDEVSVEYEIKRKTVPDVLEAPHESAE